MNFRILSILLSISIFFSCDSKKQEEKTKETKKGIEGYWYVYDPDEEEHILIFNFEEDGFFCSDVIIGASCLEDKINNCDDCHEDNSWSYTDDNKKLNLKQRGKTLTVDFRKKSNNTYFIQLGPKEVRLERTSLKGLKEKKEKKKKEEEEINLNKLKKINKILDSLNIDTYTYGYDLTECLGYIHDDATPNFLNKDTLDKNSYCSIIIDIDWEKDGFNILKNDTSFIKGHCFDFFNELNKYNSSVREYGYLWAKEHSASVELTEREYKIIELDDYNYQENNFYKEEYDKGYKEGTEKYGN